MKSDTHEIWAGVAVSVTLGYGLVHGIHTAPEAFAIGNYFMLVAIYRTLRGRGQGD